VSFNVERGETLGIVGESGSGKSVTCYSIMGLIPQPPGRIVSGTALFDGIDLLHCSPEEARAIRGKRVAMIFQDPMTSLNPYPAGQRAAHRAPAHPREDLPPRRPRPRPHDARGRRHQRRRQAHPRLIPTSFPAACASA